jgi:hypothetical protein
MKLFTASANSGRVRRQSRSKRLCSARGLDQRHARALAATHRRTVPGARIYVETVLGIPESYTAWYRTRHPNAVQSRGPIGSI